MLISFYIRLKSFDFLLFAIAFILGAIVLVADASVSPFGSLIIIQIHHISIDLLFLTLFFHAIRIRWVKPKFLVLFVGIGWFLFLFILTSLWKPMVQLESGKWLLWIVPHTFSSYYPKGAGLTFNGVIIYSTAYRFFGEFYRIFVISLLFYAYSSIKLVHPTEKMIRARKLWLIIWFMLLLHSISLFFPEITNLVSVFLLVGGLLAVYIVIFVPEALLLSHAQISRASKIYQQIGPGKPLPIYGLESYYEYLRVATNIKETKLDNEKINSKL